VSDLVALGRGGLRIGRYGFGGAPLGGLFEPVEGDQATAALDAAWNGGLRYFDTAPHYGAGLSERRIGSYLAGKARTEWVLSTKVGRVLEQATAADADDVGFAGESATKRVFDFSGDGIRRSFEASLDRLGLDHVDILYLHDPDDHWEQAISEGWPALAQLRAEGVVKSIGAGMNQSQMLARFVRETDMDVVLLAGRYTLLEQHALEDLLPACVEQSTSVVIGGVFNSGVLVKPTADSWYNYAPVPPAVLERALRLADVCARHDVPLPAAALQFPLAHPAVATVIVGARSAAEVRQNADWASLAIPDQLWADLRHEGLISDDAPTPADVR
jgi:D-threo-aldose 1-dehydrogenase